MRGLLRWLVLLLCLLGGVLALGVGRLVLADRSAPGSPAQRQAHDTLHYWGHLVLARSLRVLPGMQHHASVQYQKAAPHARTSEEWALLTHQRPHSVPMLLPDIARVSWFGVQALVTNAVVQPLLVSYLLVAGLGVLLWHVGRRCYAMVVVAEDR